MFPPTRTVTGDYRLLKFEAGTSYYLCVKDHCGGESVGLLDGAVLRIGWDDSHLAVLMVGPAAQGWRIVDLRTGHVEGPLSDDAFSEARRRRPTLGRIEPLPVEVAWDKL